jgi:transposase InsO family protein
MGRTIQFESHRNELAFILSLEFDPEVIEYWDQPPTLKLRYLSKSNKPHAVYYTPDFFVIKSTGAGWVECKTENDLLKLSENPNRFYFDEEKWRCPPGEEIATQNGFFFQVYSSDEANWIYLRNVTFLEDYISNDAPINSVLSEKIKALVFSKSGISLSELLLMCEQLQISADFIYQLIAVQILYVDLESVLLTNPSNVHIFASYDDAQRYPSNNVFDSFISSSLSWDAGDFLNWDGKNYEVVNHGESAVWLREESGNLISLEHNSLISLYERGQINFIRGEKEEITEKKESPSRIILQASPAQLEEANRRYLVLTTYAQTGRILLGTSIRSLRRWQKDYREAENIFGCGYVGLIDKRQARGNRLSKIPPQTRELSDIYIENDFETSKQATAYSVWTKLKLECEQRGTSYPSYPTFSGWVKSRPVHEQEIKRRGKVAAYQSEEFYFELTPTSPRHGERPFEIVHIDHTELDIELICSQTGKNLGRPWLTLIIDAYSRRCLGFYLSFDPPSYRSCMMAIRDMVRRYHRFPQIIVVDGGLDFSSVYFRSLLAYYNCTLKVRPGKKPRFGTLIERLFLTNHKQFIYNLLGNTQLAKDNVRFLVKEFNPKNLAIWTLEYLYYGLDEYLFEVYDRLEHSTLGVSPREMFQHGISQFGARLHKTILYDENFKLMTLPTVKSELVKVHPGRGVLVNYIHYKTPFFSNFRVENSKVPIRFDPFDSAVVYAYVANGWQRCLSNYFDAFKYRTEREMMLAIAEIRQRRKGCGRFTLNAKILAHFLLSVEAAENELLQNQRLRDMELKRLLNRVNNIVDQLPAAVADNSLRLLSGRLDDCQPNPEKSFINENEDADEDRETVDLSSLQIFGDY